MREPAPIVRYPRDDSQRVPLCLRQSTRRFPEHRPFSCSGGVLVFRTRLFHECGVVKKLCCDVSAPRGTLFKLSPAPLAPSKLATACTVGRPDLSRPWMRPMRAALKG